MTGHLELIRDRREGIMRDIALFEQFQDDVDVQAHPSRRAKYASLLAQLQAVAEAVDKLIADYEGDHV